MQATTHFAAPLIIVNGPVRGELSFHSRQNVFSNVARANSTLGRALQLILLNLGGARPDGIDMSALGNPGKFSYCIAENEEENPWEPLHVEHGLWRASRARFRCSRPKRRTASANITRAPRAECLKAISYALATVWSYRTCLGFEAVVVLGPEHVRTIHRDGFSKQNVRDFLFENTGVPLRCYDDASRAKASRSAACTKRSRSMASRAIRSSARRKRSRSWWRAERPGKFSAVLGSWSAGPRGSQMVTYPIWKVANAHRDCSKSAE